MKKYFSLIAVVILSLFLSCCNNDITVQTKEAGAKLKDGTETYYIKTVNEENGLKTALAHYTADGKIFFGDEDVTELTPENRGVGLVFQNYALYPHMTVKQNIMFPLENLKGADKLKKSEMLERAYHVAKLVQIDELMDRKPHELSGGQQQLILDSFYI